MIDAIINLVLATIAFTLIYSPFIKIFIAVNFPPQVLRIKSKQGEIVEYDFRKKNTAEDLIRFLDAVISHQEK
ncbi:hypothetical protein [Chitinophaga sp. Cy-1792]|uniref:hypothetical protein n=1 Tax=Chitinophaga sp. Cy-1792 TaxID=2608339 RepID=UPI001423D014|nr:hypothetical protein [Chitinophaga sp. Cy-1792]NIG54794.1 hypothetical protein [Chitinophaga sp. Cy-1792]